MTLNRYAKQRDANEPEIKRAFEVMFWELEAIDRPCDLIAICPRSGCHVVEFVEIKAPKTGRKTAGQVAFDQKIRGRLHYVRTTGDVVQMIEAHARRWHG